MATFEEAVAGLHAAAPERDYIVISRPIERSLHIDLSKLVERYKQNSKCTLFLTTRGGDPAAGYRIARCLRHHYQDVRLAIASKCKSAGTLIAIAANELGIGDLGELGPLDIQVKKATELWENSSGLDIQQALQTVTEHVQSSFHRTLVETRNASGLSTKLCAEFAGQVAAAIAAPLFSQIDPVRLGEMQRATRVAYSYGQRLDKYASNMKEGTLERLISDYPAHGFVIDRKEAAELFHRVSPLTEPERVFSDAVWHVLFEQADFGPWFAERPPAEAEPEAEPAAEPDVKAVVPPADGKDHENPPRQHVDG
ncbi:MAG: hypothetical protein ACTHJO_04450 [Rhodanobacter sp.]